MKRAFTLAGSTTHTALENTQHKTAFTLTEVLITLGIIGVVAAMTMPSLVANHRRKVVETRLAKFYSTINQAIQMAEAEYGDKTTWDVLENGFNQDEDGNDTTPKSLEWFNKYLKPYLNLTKSEFDGNSDSKILAYFPDGSLAMISGSSIVFYPQAKDYELLENDDKLVRNSDNCGTKYFTFFFSPWSNSANNKYHYQKGVEPYLRNWDGTEEMLRNDSALGCKKDAVSNERAYCTALIQMNGWKIPKDYPLRF